MNRIVLSLWAMNLVACGATQASAPAPQPSTPAATESPSPAPATWSDDMSKQDKAAFMKLKVAPKLGALQARYGAQGLSVLGLSTEEAQDVATFAQRTSMRYAGVAVDKHATTTRAYGVSSLPTLVVIDKQGIVRDVVVGYDPSADGRLEGVVRALLAEPAPSD